MEKGAGAIRGKGLVQVWAVLALLASLGMGVGGVTSALDELSTEAAASTAFAYQGQLRDEGGTVNDTCDLQLRLWDAAAGGAQVGSTILLEDVAGVASFIERWTGEPATARTVTTGG